MGVVVEFGHHATLSDGQRSGRSSLRDTPVSRSINITNSAGTPRFERVSQYQTCDWVVPMRSAKGFCPPATSHARRKASFDMSAGYPDLGENQPKNLCSSTYRKVGIITGMRAVDKKAFGRRLTARLDKFGRNPTEFGRETGIGQSAMQRLCAGQTGTTKHIKDIADELYTTPSWLYYAEGPEDVFPQNLRDRAMQTVLNADGPALVRIIEAAAAVARNAGKA
jgi:hypothetical protein